MDLHEGSTVMRESNTWAHGLHQGSYEAVREYNRLGFFEVAMGEDSYIVQEKNKRSVIYAPSASTSGVHGGTHGSGIAAGPMQSGTAQWRTFQDHPRFNTNYAGLRNRISFLNETYANDMHVVRIDTQYDLTLSTMKATISEMDTLKKLIAEADAQAIGRKDNPNFPDGEFVILESTMNPRDHAKEGPYYLHSWLAGAGAPIYQSISGTERCWHFAGLANYEVVIMDNFTARKSTPLGAYYLLDSDCENVVNNLRFHGIQVDQLSSPITIQSSDFQWFNVSDRWNAEDPAGWFEGRKRVRTDPERNINDGTGAMIPTWRGDWNAAPAAQVFPAGAYVVSTAQPLGMLAAILLEPGSNDGLFNWTFDEGVFVQNPLAVNYFDNRMDPKPGMVRANTAYHSNSADGGDYHVPVFKVAQFIDLGIEPEEATVAVGFPGIKAATMQYYTNVCGWQTVGVFDDACSFSIPQEHKATWGVTTLRVVKDGMYHTFTFTLDQVDDDIAWDVPLAAITVTGVTAECNLAIVQNDWVYRLAPATIGVANTFLVFDNDKKYEIRLQKPGAEIISITGVNAGQTVDISSYF
jgi:hypothetical protein